MIHYSLNIGVLMSTLPVLKIRESKDYEIDNVDITTYSVTTKIVVGKEPNLRY